MHSITASNSVSIPRSPPTCNDIAPHITHHAYRISIIPGVVETDDSDNGPDGRWSADDSDGVDSPEGYQTAKDRSQTWIKGQSRKRQSESLVEALTERITRADESERLRYERGHYTESGWKSGGLITSAGNQSSAEGL